MLLEKIYNNKCANIRVLEIQKQLCKEYYNSMMIGRILLLIRLLFGLTTGIQEKLPIDMLRDKWRNKTKNKDKNKRKLTLKQSKI